MTATPSIQDLAPGHVHQTIDVEAGNLKAEPTDAEFMHIHDGRHNGPHLNINIEDGMTSFAVYSQIHHAGERVEVVTYFHMDEDVAEAVRNHLSGPPESMAVDDKPEKDPRYITPQNHVHIPEIGGGPVTIDGNPIRVVKDGVAIKGVGNADELTTVTLTIFPHKITVDGDVH